MTLTIRVYALIGTDAGELLLSDEYRFGMRMTKFPGGGLQFGEGTIECLQREAKEELGQELCDIRHFYTTDFFIESQFHPGRQIVAVYYLASLTKPTDLNVVNKPFCFDDVEGSQSFRYVNLNSIDMEHLTFPSDRAVLAILKQKHS